LDEPLLAAAQSIREGEIVAVKGLGGFHLMVDARDSRAVQELRRRKHREEKPLAVMFPDLETIRKVCVVSEVERRILISPESPIVLLEKRLESDLLCEEIAPGNPYVGAMLPYTPLHLLLLTEVGFPVVATSGNLSDEPICIDEHEALHRLRDIADHFLIHDRPIVRHVDDSIVRIVMGRPIVLRRARGFAPLPVLMKSEMPTGLAVGGHLKNSVAVSTGDQMFLSQHIGDLENGPALDAFKDAIGDLEDLLEVEPKTIAHDLHPDYLSTGWARGSDLKTVPVQHHYAHALSCMAENEIGPPALGIAWDGTGYGTDGTIWGGEFLRITNEGFERFAHFGTFPLPGGDFAIREPRRSAIGILYSIFGDYAFTFKKLESINAFSDRELKVIKTMLERKLNTPLTSSAGRVFDAVASLIDLRQVSGFEGQAAMELEFEADRHAGGSYPFAIDREKESTIVNLSGLVRSILRDLGNAVPRSTIAGRFHNTMVEIIVSVARLSDEDKVALTGGCFQNKLLTELAVIRLREEGFKVYWHQRVPPNDGGLALGQLAALAAAERRSH
jgi:hydrogenase maturation protein HypF